VLVAEPDAMGAMAMDALRAGGYRIVELWTTGRDIPPGTMSRLLSFASARQRAASRVLSRASAPVRRLTRPWAASLDDALSAAPAFDVLVCAGSQVIFPAAFLERLRGRAVNLHPALLPHYGGPMPLHALLIDGMADQHGGMTLHLITGAIDGGPIIGQRRVALADHGTPHQWQKAVMEAMAPLLADELRAYLAGRREPVPQQPGVGSYHAARDVPLHAAPGQTVERIARYLAAAPGIQRHAQAVLPDPHRPRRFVVTGGMRIIGPVTGEAPVVGLGRIEFDALDARISLRRLTRPERFWRKIVRFVGAFGRRT
jgi:folate-dependent phosphoribosylglycinamide formyltransferase PurN